MCFLVNLPYKPSSKASQGASASQSQLKGRNCQESVPGPFLKIPWKFQIPSPKDVYTIQELNRSQAPSSHLKLCKAETVTALLMSYICIAQTQVYALEKWQRVTKVTKIGTFLHKTLHLHMYLSFWLNIFLLCWNNFWVNGVFAFFFFFFTTFKILPLKTECSRSNGITFCRKGFPSLTKKPIRTRMANFFCKEPDG